MNGNERGFDVDAFRRGVAGARSVVFEHAVSLLVVSLAWFVASLPLVTIGPATLASYATIDSLRGRGSVDRAAVVRTVRRGGVHAAALSALPAVLGTTAAIYAVEYATGGGLLAGTLTVVTGYATLYAVLVLIPAFVALSRGETPADALRIGWTWTAAHPTLALVMGLATLCLFVATAALTVAFVLSFPALAFSFHVELYDASTTERADEPTRTVRGTATHS
ncbi:hypothetical protein [Halegenticoccus tardaugens]|uniref:hypothetical protein n=1 Tax=Halegenticoccus tardaugens TaxID=2071624 RepID=UPI00100AE80D|nr:hypothetical protein [Halegenticoccus tardaugens]